MNCIRSGCFFVNICVVAMFFTSCTHFFSEKKSSKKSELEEKLAELEISSGGRIGVSAINTQNGTRLHYRADERFPMCSTFKTMVVAAILHRSMTDTHLLSKHINYSREDVLRSEYAPITAKNQAKGMSVADLCAAAMQYTDNAATNLLMQELGGPQAVNAFARSIGDSVFRVDNWEPDLNSSPSDLRDTSTPAAMEKSLQALLLGNVLELKQRNQLLTWLKSNTTGDARIRAGIPKDWVVGDRTGTCDYGSTNDTGIIWPLHGAPIVVAVYFTQKDKEATHRSDVIASVMRLLISALELEI